MKGVRVMKQQRKGFTLVELLVVIAIIALLVSILMPALGRAREMAKRVKCSANLRSQGQAMNIYANNYDDKFPVVGLRNQGKRSTFGFSPINDGTDNWLNIMVDTPNVYNIEGPYSRSSRNHLTYVPAAIYLLVRLENQPPQVFQCPSDQKYLEMDLQEFSATNENIERWEDLNAFSGRKSLSYSYWDMFNYLATTSEWGSRVLAADMNPANDTSNFEEGVIEFSWDSTDLSGSGTEQHPSPALGPYVPQNGLSQLSDIDLCVWDDSEEFPGDAQRNTKLGHGNSNLHQAEMQNVLYGDSHVEKHETPLAGVGGDNIYTQWTPNALQSDATSKLLYKTRGFWKNGGNSFGTAGTNNQNGARDELDTYLGN